MDTTQARCLGYASADDLHAEIGRLVQRHNARLQKRVAHIHKCYEAVIATIDKIGLTSEAVVGTLPSHEQQTLCGESVLPHFRGGGAQDFRGIRSVKRYLCTASQIRGFSPAIASRIFLCRVRARARCLEGGGDAESNCRPVGKDDADQGGCRKTMKNVAQVIKGVVVRPCQPGWLRTPSSYNAEYAWKTARGLSKAEGLVKTGKNRMGLGRKFEPWVVHHIERLGVHDMVGTSRLFVLYARAGQPSHAATVASTFWRQLYRSDKSDFDPWPEVDAEVQVERIDDNDYQVLLREAMAPSRVDRFWFAGDQDDPWLWHTGDQDMGLKVLADLARSGPTFGGVIFEDPHPALGGTGIEKELDSKIVEGIEFL
jgi:hypothetical protein